MALFTVIAFIVAGIALKPVLPMGLPGGPEWITGGAWGLEAGGAAVLTLLVVTFLLLYARRAEQSRPPSRLG